MQRSHLGHPPLHRAFLFRQLAHANPYFRAGRSFFGLAGVPVDSSALEFVSVGDGAMSLAGVGERVCRATENQSEEFQVGGASPDPGVAQRLYGESHTTAKSGGRGNRCYPHPYVSATQVLRYPDLGSETSAERAKGHQECSDLSEAATRCPPYDPNCEIASQIS